MSDIDAAIAIREHAHATSLLARLHSSSSSSSSSCSQHRAGLADEAYKAACAELALGKPDAALKSLKIALLSCPPEKATAVSKIRSLIAYSSQQQRNRDQHSNEVHSN